MNSGAITYRDTRDDIDVGSVVELYRANGWSAAEKRDVLHKALMNSDALISAWHAGKLVGLGNAISDGFFVVYYSHLVVMPEYHGKGVGRQLMQRLRDRYKGFHQHMLIAEGRAVEFYKKLGFVRAGKTEPMWIYAGSDH
jgi:GNAT superfamily N-acetyltransferase